MSGGGKFLDRNLMNVNPLKEQFAPTDAQPIRQHARMAGDPVATEEPTERATETYTQTPEGTKALAGLLKDVAKDRKDKAPEGSRKK